LVTNGGTGLSSTPANGALLIGNGTNYTSATLTAGTGISITNGSGSISIANSGVASITFGSTGLTPSTATNGAVTVAGTLAVANGGTGVTTSTGSGSVVLGTSPTVNNPTVTNYVESVVAIGTVTTTNTISLTNGTVQTATLTASTACTFTMPTATAGKSFVLFLKQAASTGNGTATFTSVKWGTAGAPTITATAGKMDILTFFADGTNWYGSIAQGYTP
jgi:hypothetical protein